MLKEGKAMVEESPEDIEELRSEGELECKGWHLPLPGKNTLESQQHDSSDLKMLGNQKASVVNMRSVPELGKWKNQLKIVCRNEDSESVGKRPPGFEDSRSRGHNFHYPMWQAKLIKDPDCKEDSEPKKKGQMMKIQGEEFDFQMRSQEDHCTIDARYIWSNTERKLRRTDCNEEQSQGKPIVKFAIKMFEVQTESNFYSYPRLEVHVFFSQSDRKHKSNQKSRRSIFYHSSTWVGKILPPQLRRTALIRWFFRLQPARRRKRLEEIWRDRAGRRHPSWAKAYCWGKIPHCSTDIFADLQTCLDR